MFILRPKAALLGLAASFLAVALWFLITVNIIDNEYHPNHAILDALTGFAFALVASIGLVFSIWNLLQGSGDRKRAVRRVIIALDVMTALVILGILGLSLEGLNVHFRSRYAYQAAALRTPADPRL